MKFSEDILNELNIEKTSEKEPINVMRVSEILEFMRICSERIHKKSEMHLQTSEDEIRLDCIDIVTAKLNDFSQAFKDIILFMRKEENTHNRSGNSLKYCISSYDTFGFEETEEEKLFLQELLLRNEITHDYFNQELHQQKLVWIMTNCSEGGMDVYHNLVQYCTEAKLLDRVIDKNRL